MKKLKCPECDKNNALVDPVYGITACKSCQDKSEPLNFEYHEFTSGSIKEQRKEYSRAMLQPYVNGVLSREFVEAHGTSKLAGVTKQDIKNAKYVYQGKIKRHHKIGESKI